MPRGFTGYIYNWCPNLGTRYTPMRTPGYVERQVKRLAANKVQALYRDGPGQLFGLEGPVYYVMGRMFDDPEKNAAKELLPEFCEAAFQNKSIAFYMRAFYDELYNAIALYSDHLGTRCDLWTFQPLPGVGRPRKTVQDPFQLIAFLYPPRLLADLESYLSQAEQLAKTPKVKTRLALVRTEFEYLKHFARVVHLHQAYQMAPDSAAINRLLDAIDARNAFIAALYDKRGNARSPGNWSYVLFPFGGHDANHLRLAYDGYQEPYAKTCFNWDTKAMRNAPAPGKKKLTVARANGTDHARRPTVAAGRRPRADARAAAGHAAMQDHDSAALRSDRPLRPGGVRAGRRGTLGVSRLSPRPLAHRPGGFRHLPGPAADARTVLSLRHRRQRCVEVRRRERADHRCHGPALRQG